MKGFSSDFSSLPSGSDVRLMSLGLPLLPGLPRLPLLPGLPGLPRLPLLPGLLRLARLPLLLGLVLLFSLAGCRGQGDNYLEGSLADTYAMTFKTTRVRLYESELSIEYVAGRDQGEMVTLRVTLARDGSPLEARTDYNLATQGTVGRSEASGSPLPDLESGGITFSRVGTLDGDEVAGQFSGVFETPNGSRLTLRGGFSSALEVVQFP